MHEADVVVLVEIERQRVHARSMIAETMAELEGRRSMHAIGTQRMPATAGMLLPSTASCPAWVAAA
jgi:hypothetical protein